MSRLTLNQAILSVAFAVLLPILAFGAMQNIASRDYARQLIGERLVSSALATAASQREAFSLAQNMLMSAAADPDVVAATTQCAPSLKRALSGQNAVINLLRSDKNGVAQCSAMPLVQPVSNAREPWWIAGKQASDVTMSAPVLGKITRKSIIIAMLPVRANGQFDGAVTAGIDTSWLEKSLERRRLSKSAVVAIVDAKGDVLLSSGPRGFSRVDLGASQGRAAVVETEDGSTWHYASAPLFRRQLHVVYAERQGVLLDPSQDQLRADLILAITTIVITLLILWIAINYFVLRWLRALRVTAAQFAKGDYASDPGRFDDAPSELADLDKDLRELASSIMKRDAALTQAAADNQAMAREVNPRVKINLQMVMSLVELQAARISDVPSRLSLEQTRLRIGVIALIHRILYDHGESSEYGSVDMDRLAQEICAQLRNANLPSINLHCQSAIGEMSVDRAIPMSLFLVEAVTNAYRHAFVAAEANRVDVALTGTADCGEIRIVDNGIGFANASDSNTMGQQLMTAYAEQLNGEFTRTQTAGGGTTITLTFRPRPAPSAM